MRARRRPCTAAPFSGTVGETDQELLDVQRVALRGRHDERTCRRVELAAARQLVEELDRDVVRHRPEWQLDGPVRIVRVDPHAHSPAARAALGPHGADEQERDLIRELEQLVGEVARGRIRPVEILDRDDDGTALRKAPHPLSVRAADSGCELLRLQACRRSSASGSSVTPSSRARYGMSAATSKSGKSSSLAWSFVRTDRSASPSSAPTQARSIPMKGSYSRSAPNETTLPFQPRRSARAE